MTKAEFLNTLRLGLIGELSDKEIISNVKFYEDYITGSGKSEDEVISELGDPRLIAKTIIESHKMSQSGSEDEYSSYNNWDNSGEKNYQNKTNEWNNQSKSSKFKSNIKKIFSIILFVFIFLLILRIGGFILRLLFPIILIGIVLGFIIRLFKR